MHENFGRRSTDIGNKIIPFKLKTLLKYSGYLIGIVFMAGMYWKQQDTRFSETNARIDVTNSRISETNCNVRMIMDVVVYKKKPQQPNCDR